MNETFDYKRMDYLSLTDKIRSQSNKLEVMRDYRNVFLAEQRITESDSRDQRYRQVITNTEAELNTLRAEERRRSGSSIAW